MENINKKDISQELQESYLDYAMSVIVQRALPDARDGMKPVQRRILYAMYTIGLRASAKTRKSATVVGEVLGKYHPHGDIAVYDALVRMAQPFSLRYPMVHGQGNFGCFTKDTKIKLTDGRNLNFEELIKEDNEGKVNYTFAFNHENEKIEIAKINNPRLTKKNQKLVEITLDNGEKIRCTLDHPFMLRNGKYKKARDLKPNDSLMPLYTKLHEEDKNLRGCLMLMQPFQNAWEFVHRLADNWNVENGIYEKKTGEIRHHKDFNKLNNNPDNIIRIPWQNHFAVHSRTTSERHKNDIEYVNKLNEWRKEYWSKKENREKASYLMAKTNKKNWKNDAYREKRAIENKTLSYACSLQKEYGAVTPELYETKRTNNSVPKFINAMHYFASIKEANEKAKTYNHRVKAAIFLTDTEDVYDLTINKFHNFSLAAGIFVHNSVDGDSAAAMRYTECKLTKAAEEALFDIEKETVKFAPNYDGVHTEPSVLPSRIPQLLMNGALGIAVGMATSIPPHNLTELCNALIKLIDDPEITNKDIMKIIKGPDFPTGGIIYDRKAITEAYSTGKGPVVIRAVTDIVENKKGQFQIIVSELPYQVNKSTLLEKIADLVKNKRIEGIRDIRDESDKEGLRIAIDLKNDAHPQKVLNKLFKMTDFEKVFHLNMLALVDGLQPQILSIKSALEIYINHRKDIITKRSQYDLKKARERMHILEGLSRALDHIEEIIQLIKKSPSKEVAYVNLQKEFKFSDVQTTAILEMRLQTLAGLERKKIEDELLEKKKLIAYLEDLLGDPKKILKVVKEDLNDIIKNYGDERKTKVVNSPVGILRDEDIIPDEEVLITLSHEGYIKQMPVEAYKAQKRGGKGISAISSQSEDMVSKMFAVSTHDNILFFTNKGKVYQIKAYEIPQASRLSKGKAIVNFLQLETGEIVTAAISLTGKETSKYLAMITENGIIKKVKADAFSDVRKSGLIAIRLNNKDVLKWVNPTNGEDDIFIATTKGQSIRFPEKQARPMGRNAAGIKAINLKNGDKVIGVEIIEKNMKNNILSIAENGFGKMSSIEDFRLQGRGGTGIRLSKVTEKTGKVIGIKLIRDEQDLIAISKKGQIIRLSLKEVQQSGRNTQGVRIMRLNKNDKVVDISCI